MIFRKRICPFDVIDNIEFFDGKNTLPVNVRADAASLVVNIKKAYDKLSGLTDESPEETKAETARMFARAIFGQEDGDKLCAFYRDPLVVISICGKYFKERLAAKITKAQKK